MVWRMAVRGIIASKFYGWREAVRSAPRAVLANIIAIMAARRAMLHYIRISRGKMPVWEKTTHHFPEEFRSEEHTSELQSLMRISYAVFCLNKNTLPFSRSQKYYKLSAVSLL